MQLKQIIVLHCIVFVSLLACSDCYIAHNSLESLEGKDNIRLEIHTIDGDVYGTRKFHVTNDTLFIQDNTSVLHKDEIKIPSSSITYVNVCELNSKKGQKAGMIFAACILGPVIIISLLSLDYEPW